MLLKLTHTFIRILIPLIPHTTKPLATHSAILTALETGTNVSVTLNLALCTPEPGKTGRIGRSGIHITAYNISDTDDLAFSYHHFTVAGDDGAPINQLMRFLVRPDGTVRITVHVFNLPGLELRRAPAIYNCSVNHGLRFYVGSR